jgi:peptide methionine sulfoxide reductase msrA/msrB
MNKFDSLTPEQKYVLCDKGTEPPFSGDYIEAVKHGSYLCRQCGKALFRADNQFTSQCGWPSFDDQLTDTVKQQPDADGRRTEIVCACCDGHLGHVFRGENYTAKNCRHCVNSISIEFVDDESVLDTEEAIVAGGCFWGVEYLFQQLDGVLLTEVGYCGGELDYPSYRDVCRKDTGHLEAMRIVYDKNKLGYQEVIQYFFEIHDFTQTDGQGPDLGPQYLSAIFYYNDEQKKAAQAVMKLLKDKGFTVATQLYPVSTFWPAEIEHQAYYQKQGKQPYCHSYRKIFS